MKLLNLVNAALLSFSVFAMAPVASAAPAANVRAIALLASTQESTIEAVGPDGSKLLNQALAAMPEKFFEALDEKGYQVCKAAMSGRISIAKARYQLHKELQSYFVQADATPEQARLMEELVGIIRFSAVYNNCRGNNAAELEMVP